MISQQRVEALCQRLEALFIPDGPLNTPHGARDHVRRSIIGMLRNPSLGSYEHITHLIYQIGHDAAVQAVNDRQPEDLRAEYAEQANAWKEFDPLVQALWSPEREANQ